MQRFSAMDGQCVERGTKIEQMKELETAKQTETRQGNTKESFESLP